MDVLQTAKNAVVFFYYYYFNSGAREAADGINASSEIFRSIVRNRAGFTYRNLRTGAVLFTSSKTLMSLPGQLTFYKPNVCKVVVKFLNHLTLFSLKYCYEATKQIKSGSAKEQKYNRQMTTIIC